MEGLDDEVAEDVSGTAKFMARNEVSNVVDGNVSEMQETQLRKKIVNKVCSEVFGEWEWVSNSVDSRKGCRIVVGWDTVVFTPVLLSQSSQINATGRRDLWKNIKDNNSIAGSFPWELLGDYNVILNFNENSRGMRVNNVGVHEFKDCVEAVNLEDIKITGLFFMWIQKRRDPNNGILKKLDRVMGNGKFVDEYINGFASFLPFGVSDHSPAVLVVGVSIVEEHIGNLVIVNEKKMERRKTMDPKIVWFYKSPTKAGNASLEKVIDVPDNSFANKMASSLRTLSNPDLVEMMNLRRCRNTFSSRFQSLLSQLEIHGAGVSTKDANQKFLRLYTSTSSTHNVAFVSSKSTNSTNDVSTAYGVSTSSSHNSQNEGSSSYTDELKVGLKDKVECFNCHNTSTLLESEDQKEIKKAEGEMHGTLDIKQKTMGGDLENRRNLKL
ncbi:hypothetical protein Tco_1122655 [Tanacetum coccineum]|uniref:Uncharacterized protein n=1 Tax=Tanacetum coccineum TaxID=301880 RepID=A0ABQ5J183_9ASTR